MICTCSTANDRRDYPHAEYCALMAPGVCECGPVCAACGRARSEDAAPLDVEQLATDPLLRREWAESPGNDAGLLAFLRLVSARAALAPQPDPASREYRDFHDHQKGQFCTDACGARAVLNGLPKTLEDVLADEPQLIPPPSDGVARWYSEGWNRCARDIRAALARPASPALTVLDVERLAEAIADAKDHHWPLTWGGGSQTPFAAAIAREYAALSTKGDTE